MKTLFTQKWQFPELMLSPPL